MNFSVLGEQITLEFEAVIIAGFTGRDRARVLQHVEELASAGVRPPANVPTFYLVSPDTLTQADVITMLHPDTSGEVEIALLVTSGDIYITAASDHTDRRLERQDIALSKQICPKVLAREAWPLTLVAGHWDQLRLRSWVQNGTGRTAYQSGLAGELLDAQALLATAPFRRRPDSFLLLGGTVPALGGIRGSSHFAAELIDPVAGRSISLDYSVRLIDDVLQQPSVEETLDGTR